MTAVSTAPTPENPESADRPTPLRRRGRSLAHDLVDSLAGEIRAGRLRPGDKLPTESEFMKTWGVSRTVVREALSRLQAAGAVETRHGIGTFVLAPAAGQGFRIDPAELATAVDVLAVLELRISLETESAGLAAQRRTDWQLQGLRAALDDLENASTQGDAIGPDLRFHIAIAEATGNRYFADIMAYLGATLIPRARINSPRIAMEDLPQYLRRVNREHEEIYEAIARRDAESARAAMRLHLTNSRERLRRAQEATEDKD
ncbi:FadR/GntR family transcriptional regulator [Ramlibacter humi]|uniref:FadR family transcriptional regulator n=1 Tax=Ramlibacter humi TaxID=2530451 RepID=A0A4Z0BH42_9BURK|nr:FadR/GntR family transcriptional regulator [Ramlibacter humi]TFY97709.1 FadR family transcriptional regulator [Ramlibacter humi]